jgi:predicted nucleotide-binding protein (sugar kinase/HSP70/actin superfamily)
MTEEKRIEDLTIEKEKKETPKPVVEKIPDKILEKIKKLREDKAKYLNEMLKISVQSTQLRNRQDELVKLLGSNQDSTVDSINRAFKKLRLEQKKEYRWRYNGVDSFIGFKAPEKKQEK